MSRDRVRHIGVVTVLPLVAIVVAACHRSSPPAMVPLPPSIPQQQVAPPSRTASSVTETIDTIIGEERVQVDTHGREVDVRDILTFLGRRAGVQFVYGPEINKKVRLTIVDVPVSLAIETVLSLAGLALEPIGEAKRPASSAVVFYQLPVNVDSLSTDAIMKRFGVGRGIAEIMVEARTRRP